MLPISIKDLKTCFESIEFSLKSGKSDNVTVSHPRFRDDGHRIGLVFKKIPFPSGKVSWELVTNVRIIEDYGP